MITASTYGKKPHFRGTDRLTLLYDSVLGMAEMLEWRLDAWAVFPNHYHLIGHSPQTQDPCGDLALRLHGYTARELNRLDDQVGRMVWYRSWATKLTFEKSFLARLAYVHNNARHHGLVGDPVDYPYCSAAWFARGADRPFYETVMSFKTDRVNVVDGFEVEEGDWKSP